MSRAPFELALLNGAHERTTFNSGSAPLDRYLHEQVTQDVRRRVAACLVATTEGKRIAGYYTLASASLLLAELPATTGKKLPRYLTVPAVRMGSLAVDQRFKGQGLCSALLALGRAALPTKNLVLPLATVRAVSGTEHPQRIAASDYLTASQSRYTIPETEDSIMAHSTMLHVRVDDEIKTQASEALAAMGLSVSDAVRILLKRVVNDQAFPLELKVPNGQTRAAMEEARAMAKARTARFDSADALIDDLEKARQ